MKLIKDSYVHLHWSKCATERTKDRIKEFGPKFLVVVPSQETRLGCGDGLCFPGKDSAFLEGTGVNHWLGWIPLDELIILGKEKSFSAEQRSSFFGGKALFFLRSKCSFFWEVIKTFYGRLL
jgi:hypothetical protein